MRRLKKLSERDFDRILSDGSIPHDRDAEDLASFVRAARRRTALPPSIEALHLTAVVDAARKLAPAAGRSAAPAGRRPRLLRTLVPAGVAASILAKMAAATAAVLTTVGGLTAAGVLPSDAAPPAAMEVTESGESGRGFLPAPLEEGSVASEHASQTAKDVLAVIDGWLAGGYATGCEFGQAVAEAAGGQPKGQCPGAGGEEGEGGPGNSEEAKTRAAERSAEGKSKGAEKSEAGKAKGSEASSGSRDNAPQTPPADGGGSGGSGSAPPNPGKP